MRSAPHFRIGDDGEAIARSYLDAKGYLIIGSNVRIGKHDEIDIVAYDPVDRVLAFVEVKSRAKDDPDYRPDMNLTPAKRSRMARAARAWIDRNAWPGGYRLDAVWIAQGAVKAHVEQLDWC